MAVLVDSNVILDVATADPAWGEWSSQALARAADESILVINPIVYAEVSVGFDRVEGVSSRIGDVGVAASRHVPTSTSVRMRPLPASGC